MIVRDGRAQRLDIGPGEGRLTHQVGEGATSLLDGVPEVHRPPITLAPLQSWTLTPTITRIRPAAWHPFERIDTVTIPPMPALVDRRIVVSWVDAVTMLGGCLGCAAQVDETYAGLCGICRERGVVLPDPVRDARQRIAKRDYNRRARAGAPKIRPRR